MTMNFHDGFCPLEERLAMSEAIFCAPPDEEEPEGFAAKAFVGCEM
jgi:hypothetical protein